METIERMTDLTTDTWLDYGVIGDRFFVEYSDGEDDVRQVFPDERTANIAYEALKTFIEAGRYTTAERIKFLTTVS